MQLTHFCLIWNRDVVKFIYIRLLGWRLDSYLLHVVGLFKPYYVNSTKLLDSNWTRTFKTSEVGHKTSEDFRSWYDNIQWFPECTQNLPNIFKVDSNSSEDFIIWPESFRRFLKSARRLPKLTRKNLERVPGSTRVFQRFPTLDRRKSLWHF